jgi:hypothetical protein
MGFDDFDGQLIKIEKASAGLGIKATIAYLTFTGLGSGASMLAFDKGFGLSGPKLEGVAISGQISMDSPDPGDWWEVDRTDSIPVTTDKTQQDGIFVLFPTAKSSLSDLTRVGREGLKAFVEKWASRF